MPPAKETIIDSVSNEVISSEQPSISPIMKQVEEFNKSVEVDVDDQIDILSAQITTIFRNREINSSNWMNLVTQVIQCVEGVVGLNGGEKKELAIDIIIKSKKNLNLPTDNLILDKLLSRDSLDNTIDLLISVSKGQIDLNKIKKVAVSCILGCIKNNTFEPAISVNNINTNIDFYHDLIEDFKEKQINMSNWMSIITRVMQDVDKVKNLSGPEKKDQAIQITIKIFEKLNIADETLRPLFTHSTLSSVVDTIISTSKNKVKLNTKVNAKKIKKK
jgi:hypothetical protein